MRGGGGADDDVGGGQELWQVVEAPGGPAELTGQRLSLLECPVRDQHGRSARRLQVPSGDLAHLARAEDQNGVTGQRLTEDLGRQLDGRRADRERPARDAGLGPGALPGDKCFLEEFVQTGADALSGLRGFQSRLDLTLDVRLAQNHRVQARGDREQVVRRRPGPVAVKMTVELAPGQAMPAC